MIAGVLLVTVPAKTESNNQNNVHAASETINGHEYLIYDVYNSTNHAEIGNYTAKYPYVKLVFHENYTRTGQVYFGNGDTLNKKHALIVDLNGYTLTSDTLDFNTTYLEIWDSSAEHTGQIICNQKINVQFNITQVTLRGGRLQAPIMRYAADKVNIYAGCIECNQVEVYPGTNYDTWVAPYLLASYDETGVLQTVRPYDNYTISSSPYVTGIYNYEYGLNWGLSVYQLLDLAVPADKTYYLWGRNADGWYEYLNVIYRDGAWVKVS